MTTPIKAPRPAPKKVPQDTSKFHCWAASLESWIDARRPTSATMHNIHLPTQQDLIEKFKHFTTANDGLMVGKAMVDIMIAYQMKVDIYQPKKKGPIPGHAIQQRLRDKSYLWAFYLGGPDLGAFLGHAVVIYDMLANHTLRVMDPWGGVLTYLPISELNKTDTVFICWNETGPGWTEYLFQITQAVMASVR